MRVGLDGIVFRGRDAGTLRYSEQLLRGLAACSPEHRYVIFGSPAAFRPEATPRSSRFIYLDPRPKPIFPRALQQQLYRSWSARGPLDLLHSLAFVPPLGYRGATVTTIHDLVFVVHPETKKWTGRLWWNIFGRKGIEKSDRIMAVSECTRRDLIRLFHVPGEKVRVVYPCTRDLFHPSDSGPMRTKYHLPSKYILYVGTLERRKNIANVIRAYSEARRMGLPDHALVLAGEPGWLYGDISRTVEELDLRDRVHFTGYVPDEDLPGLYSGADLFVFLSKYEGFGLPVLEAMACGVPVLASNVSSLPEVVGDAGVLIPPDDVQCAAHEILRIISDKDLRSQMRTKGLDRASGFTPERMGREALAVYEEAVQCVSA